MVYFHPIHQNINTGEKKFDVMMNFFEEWGLEFADKNHEKVRK